MAGKFAKYSDAELLKIVKTSGRKANPACSELYDRYADMIYRYCLYMTDNGDAAEDIFQNAFIKSINKINTDAEKINLKAYLYSTARNMCINHLRSVKFIYDYDFTGISSRDYENHQGRELYDLIVSSLDLLDLKYREAFILREIEGLSYKEIGRMLNISWSGAQSRVIRAKEKLMDVLAPFIKDFY
jgi:RNA polymerase sigma-70 factor (ECF subfamily)